MKTQILRIDGTMYTRVAAVFIDNKEQLRAFKNKKICKIGKLEHAEQAAAEINETGREARLVSLAWFWHPSLSYPVLSEAVFPNSARIILVRVF